MMPHTMINVWPSVAERFCAVFFFFWFSVFGFSFVRFVFFFPLSLSADEIYGYFYVYIRSFRCRRSGRMSARSRAHNSLVLNVAAKHALNQTREGTNESVHLTLVWILCAENCLYFMGPYFSAVAADEPRGARAPL